VKNNFTKPTLAAAVLLSSFILHPASLLGQGSLTPSGAPAPTMKTLAQIEARTPVDAITTPGNASEQFIITQPGSYYLTGDISGVTGKDGISIQTNDVTLDLNGFAMTGASAPGNGITVSGSGMVNIVIRNGTMRNWSNGVLDLNGYCELERLRIYACQYDAGNGIYIGDHCVVKNCSAIYNSGAGIQVGNDCVLTDCLVCSNSVGIFGLEGCVLNDCHATTNVVSINVEDNFDISHCTADLNAHGFSVGNNGRIRGCLACANTYIGITAQAGVNVSECTADGNGGSGILIEASSGDSVVIDNHVAGNGLDGIASFGTGNRIEHNKATSNGGHGINSVGGSGADIIVRNTCSGNSAGNYTPTSGTTFAPIQTPATATNSFANF
jgi:parallel beta-helix repeat protein